MIFKIHLHLVWITKYRKKILEGDVAIRVRDVIREICRSENVEIIKGHVSRDYVHLCVSIPPQVCISRLAQWLKGKSSHKLLHEFDRLRKLYWGRHFWQRGYFCCSNDDVTDDMIKQYIENQHHDIDENFKIEEAAS